MVSFLYGAATMGSAAAALFFLRFWRETREALFLCFAVAFLIFAVDYALLGAVPLANESRSYVFLLRLLGFAAILYGIGSKNRDG